MKKRNILSFIFIVFCFIACTQKTKQNRMISVNRSTVDTVTIKKISIKSELLEKIKNIIKTKLEDYIIPDADLFISNWRDEIELSGGNKAPYLCTSDFNGDKYDDYGIILLHKDKKHILICVIISIGDIYKIVNIKKLPIESSESIDVVLSIKAKGVWEGIDSTLNAKYDGLSILYILESKTDSYYWNGRNFEKFYYD